MADLAQAVAVLFRKHNAGELEDYIRILDQCASMNDDDEKVQQTIDRVEEKMFQDLQYLRQRRRSYHVTIYQDLVKPFVLRFRKTFKQLPVMKEVDSYMDEFIKYYQERNPKLTPRYFYAMVNPYSGKIKIRVYWMLRVRRTEAEEMVKIIGL